MAPIRMPKSTQSCASVELSSADASAAASLGRREPQPSPQRRKTVLTEDTTPAPHFIDGKPRSRAIPLDYPLSYKDRDYREIFLHRLTTSEVADYQKEIEALAKSGTEV